MSEQEPGAVTAYLDQHFGEMVQTDTPFRQWARAHDAEDARLKDERDRFHADWKALMDEAAEREARLVRAAEKVCCPVNDPVCRTSIELRAALAAVRAGNAMSETITFDCPLPPRGLRRNSETCVMGWRAKLKAQYQEDVWCAGWKSMVTNGRHDLTAPWERAVLHLTWRHAGVAPDADNALASLKPLIDVLHTRSSRPLSIIVDDSPAHLRIEPVELVKVRHRAEEGVTVRIERLR